MKLNKNQEFYNESYINITSALYDEAENVANELTKEQSKNEKELLTKVALIMLTYKVLGEVMNMSKAQQLLVADEVNNLIDELFAKETKVEINKIKTLLKDTSKNRYYSNQFLQNLGIQKNEIKHLSEKKIDEILNFVIEGKTYADRVKVNKKLLANELKLQIKNFLKGEISVNEIKTVISKKFKINKYNTERLVEHEVARVMSQINEQWFIENGTEKLLYVATLDRRTCSDCGALDGQVFDREDTTRPELPRHVRCRCVYSELVDENWRPKSRMDNETHQKIDYKSYEEWKQENNID